jgi:hypothetical protein
MRNLKTKRVSNKSVLNKRRKTRRRKGGGTKSRFIIRLVSDREGWDLDETFGPYNTEKEAVTACLSYMLNPNERNETLSMDLIRGVDEEWMDENPTINPNREDMTEQLLRDTDTFEKLKKVCETFHNSFYKDGWDISMEVKRIDEQTSNNANNNNINNSNSRRNNNNSNRNSNNSNRNNNNSNRNNNNSNRNNNNSNRNNNNSNRNNNNSNRNNNNSNRNNNNSNRNNNNSNRNSNRNNSNSNSNNSATNNESSSQQAQNLQLYTMKIIEVNLVLVKHLVHLNQKKL